MCRTVLIQHHRSLVLAVFALMLACSNGAPTPVIDRVPPPATEGEWGGEHIALTLGPTGGTVQYDCAHGSLSGGLRPNGAGAFDIPGMHVREHGGPVREGEAVDSVPARYVGTLAGDRMSLRVVVAGADTLGPFELRRSEAARVVRCL